ncbi:MAG TPA: thioredoxin domain-containing protein [Gemmatimonadaceae bacterium]|nr:thioredoxin domain-containing protein [Gemmatimonadaceae bacterium]
MANRLAHETSPYLRHHAHNPVDWYPWGAEALDRARREERPILLSVGYAACHWCHVMERESFENAGTAALMNARFVCIKVDREERPDLDAIYMQAVQALTGHGGWPMTVFLTPEGEPFYGGTYYPPDDRHGMPSFRRVLEAVSDAYANRRGDVRKTTDMLRQIYDAAAAPATATGALDAALLERAYRAAAAEYDARYGGFRGAPKFPQAMSLDAMLAVWARTGEPFPLEVAARSFRAMARGGIYDQVGGGFARYATDAGWLVPHFEKMLYDNALLGRLAVHLWQATGDDGVRRVCEETFDWVAREMTAPGGGFYSTLDADSEGEEGKFYLWTADELDALLGADAPLVRAYYGVEAGGNFEGRSILHVPDDLGAAAARAAVEPAALRDAVDRARRTLYDARSRRVWPARDEKILAAWNGLMLRAVAEGARAFESTAYRDLALRNGEFLFREMVRDGRVMRVHTDGVTRLAGYLEDHAAVALGALSLYELTFDRIWLDRARDLGSAIVRWFWDEETGAFFDTARDHESLITRPRDVSDNATPSGTSLAVELSLRLAELFGDPEHRERGERVLASLAEPMARHPLAFGHLLSAADLAVYGAVQLAVVGDPSSDAFRALARESARQYVPSLVIAGGAAADNADVPLLADRPLRDGLATAYLCRAYACNAPVTAPGLLAVQLEETRTG